MPDDPKEELRHLKGALLYYQNLISNHDKLVNESAQKVTQAKKDFAEILQKRDEAPVIIKNYKHRIAQAEVKLGKTMAIDPQLRKVINLREKLRKLEEELGSN